MGPIAIKPLVHEPQEGHAKEVVAVQAVVATTTWVDAISTTNLGCSCCRGRPIKECNLVVHPDYAKIVVAAPRVGPTKAAPSSSQWPFAMCQMQ